MKLKFLENIKEFLYGKDKEPINNQERALANELASAIGREVEIRKNKSKIEVRNGQIFIIDKNEEDI